MKTYRQLSRDERYQIQALLRSKVSVPAIAAELGRSPSTVYREVARNSRPMNWAELDRVKPPPRWHRYIAEGASKRAAQRRVVKGAAQRKIQGDLQAIVESKLRLRWSPEQICARLGEETKIKLSHETVYQHILRDSRRLGFYRYCLRYGGYKHHRFKKSRHAERTWARMHHIEDRPQEANDRTEIGHWERDLLLGKRGGPALLVLQDRRSRYVRVRKVASTEADVVAKATQLALAGMPLKTLTNDNGVEFKREQSLERALGIPIYFCNPASPWERGSVENANGLIRQYCPKSCDFEEMASWGPKSVEECLNFRPKRVLGWKTPYEVFHGTQLQLIRDRTMHFGLEFSRAI
jgi:IS30 family transposase